MSSPSPGLTPGGDPCALAAACAALDVTLLAEGVETADGYAALGDVGVRLQQGYFFARPAFQASAEPVWPVGSAHDRELTRSRGPAGLNIRIASEGAVICGRPLLCKSEVGLR